MAAKDDVADIPAIKQAVLEASEKLMRLLMDKNGNIKFLNHFSFVHLNKKANYHSLKFIKKFGYNRLGTARKKQAPYSVPASFCLDC
jgi:hypothetical protein